MKVFFKYFIIVSILFSWSCEHKSQFDVELSNVPKPNSFIDRYEQVMFTLPQDSFIYFCKIYHERFHVFLEGDVEDTLALLAVKSFFSDPYMKELYTDVSLKYANLEEIEMQLNNSLHHFAYYFPNLPTPQLFSYVSGLDFKYPVKFISGSILIGLDMYLGADYKAYKVSGFPLYRTRWAIPQMIVPDAMAELATGLMEPLNSSANLLQNIIHSGKTRFFVKSMMPELPDTLLLKYSSQQLEWIESNEAYVWSYIIENQLLYSTDKNMVRKFSQDGPFTDMFNKKSPPRVNEYIGFQIIKKYADETNASLKEILMEKDYQKILKRSRYKPKL
ncbi:MAG: hypothetical protein JXR34_00780 [Bacteroidales bacterium]|nr:hypothetical protein [Bacteroidales bacterium]